MNGVQGETVVTRSGRKTVQKYRNLNFRQRGTARSNAGTADSIDQINMGKDQETIQDEASRQTTEIQRLTGLVAEMQRQIEAVRVANRPNERNVGPPHHEGNIIQRELATIIDAQNSRLDVPIPIFENENSANPVKFLDDMETYFQAKNTQETRKIVIMESALKGKASVWYHLTRAEIRNFQDFKKMFLSEFYSVRTQVEIKRRWESECYDPQEGDLQGYFYKKIQESNFFIPKLTSYEVNYVCSGRERKWNNNGHKLVSRLLSLLA